MLCCGRASRASSALDVCALGRAGCGRLVSGTCSSCMCSGVCIGVSWYGWDLTCVGTVCWRRLRGRLLDAGWCLLSLHGQMCHYQILSAQGKTTSCRWLGCCSVHLAFCSVSAQAWLNNTVDALELHAEHMLEPGDEFV